MHQKEEKIRVCYDLEKDAYYRVNQEDGRMERSFKNGEPFKIFNADISGRDYKSRGLKRDWSIWANPKKKINSNHQKTISHNNNHPQYNSQKISIDPQVTRQSRLINRQLRKYESQGKFQFIANILIDDGDSLMKENQNRKNNNTNTNTNTNANAYHDTRQDTFNSILKRYESISSNRVYENHSPLKKQSGLHLHQNSINQKGFRQSKNIINFHPISKIKLKRATHNSRQPSPQNQTISKHSLQLISKQKSIFLKYHPQHIIKENARAAKEMTERKINFKKLQQLFIEQNNKITDHIYCRD